MTQTDKIEDEICSTVEIMYAFLYPVYDILIPHLIAYEGRESGELNLAFLLKRQRNIAQGYHQRHPQHHFHQLMQEQY
jgi:hypothetical protein